MSTRLITTAAELAGAALGATVGHALGRAVKKRAGKAVVAAVAPLPPIRRSYRDALPHRAGFPIPVVIEPGQIVRARRG